MNKHFPYNSEPGLRADNMHFSTQNIVLGSRYVTGLYPPSKHTFLNKTLPQLCLILVGQLKIIMELSQNRKNAFQKKKNWFFSKGVDSDFHFHIKNCIPAYKI